jgi:hypothetical protein
LPLPVVTPTTRRIDLSPPVVTQATEKTIPPEGKLIQSLLKEDQDNIPRSLNEEHDVSEETNTSPKGNPVRHGRPDRKHRRDDPSSNLIFLEENKIEEKTLTKSRSTRGWTPTPLATG